MRVSGLLKFITLLVLPTLVVSEASATSARRLRVESDVHDQPLTRKLNLGTAARTMFRNAGQTLKNSFGGAAKNNLMGQPLPDKFQEFARNYLHHSPMKLKLGEADDAVKKAETFDFLHLVNP